MKGITENGQVRIKGVWANVWEDREPVQNSTYEQATGFAYANDLPFVEIIKDIVKRDDAKASLVPHLFETPDSFAFQRNGKRFFLNFKKGKFIVVDGKYNTRMMRKDEFDFAYDILQVELDEKIKKEFSKIIESLPTKFKEAEYKKTKSSPRYFKRS